MALYRANETRRGRPSKLNKLIADLYREGKCRECSVKVTRMDFAKILGKFTKVKIQYESTPRPEKFEKKITSPVGNARLRSNENGMVLIHRSAYKEHPAKPAPPALPETPTTPAPRKRGRPPKTPRPAAPALPTVTQYRIVFCEKRDSVDVNGCPHDVSMADLLTALSADVLPTTEWLIDYLLHDEPTNDRVYDRIAAELEDLMYDSKPCATVPTAPSTTRPDDFPSIMELLSDAAEPEQRSGTDSTTENKENTQLNDSKPQENSQSVANDQDFQDTVTKQNSTEKQDTEDKMEVDNETTAESDSGEQKTPVPAADTTVEDDTDTKSSKEEPAAESSSVNRCPVNGTVTVIGEHKVNIETVNYIVFKKVKNDKCNRLVKCSKNLNYSIEIDGQPVELLGAPKYVACVDDLRLMLQIVDECDLNSFNVVLGG